MRHSLDATLPVNTVSVTKTIHTNDTDEPKVVHTMSLMCNFHLALCQKLERTKNYVKKISWKLSHGAALAVKNVKQNTVLTYLLLLWTCALFPPSFLIYIHFLFSFIVEHVYFPFGAYTKANGISDWPEQCDEWKKEVNFQSVKEKRTVRMRTMQAVCWKINMEFRHQFDLFGVKRRESLFL